METTWKHTMHSSNWHLCIKARAPCRGDQRLAAKGVPLQFWLHRANCAKLCYTVLHMAQEMTAQYLQNTFRTLQIFALVSSWMLLPIYIFSAFVRAISTTQQLFGPSNRFFLVDWMRAVTAFWNHDKETI